MAGGSGPKDVYHNAKAVPFSELDDALMMCAASFDTTVDVEVGGDGDGGGVDKADPIDWTRGVAWLDTAEVVEGFGDTVDVAGHPHMEDVFAKDV